MTQEAPGSLTELRPFSLRLSIVPGVASYTKRDSFFSPALVVCVRCALGVNVHLPLRRVGATYSCVRLLYRALLALPAFPYRLCLLRIACDNKV